MRRSNNCCDLAVKSHCSVGRIHVNEAQLRVEVASKEIEISHVAVDVVHLICGRDVKTNPLSETQVTQQY